MPFLFFIYLAAFLSLPVVSMTRNPVTSGGHQLQTMIIDSAELESIREEDFQQEIDSFFENTLSDIDTFAWSSSRVNSGRIDCSYLFDTVRIALVDESIKKNYVHPFKGHVTSDFGKRNYGLWHYGVDIKLNKGDSVSAAFDGIVRAVINDRHGYGKVVVIRHCWGVESIYGHLSKTMTKANEKVRAGEIIGLGGSTGRSSGSHLHFEMRYYGEPFNPNCIIDFENFKIKSDTLKLYKDDFAYLKQARTTIRHRVQKGDNLGKIAPKYGISINRICSLNGITPQLILKIGKKLVVRVTE